MWTTIKKQHKIIEKKVWLYHSNHSLVPLFLYSAKNQSKSIECFIATQGGQTNRNTKIYLLNKRSNE